MTRNIRIYEAEWVEGHGYIIFSRSLRDRRRWRVRDGVHLTLSRQTDETLGKQEVEFEPPEIVTREEVLELIAQGDNTMWTWPTFMATWEGFAAGFEAGRDFERDRQASHSLVHAVDVAGDVDVFCRWV